MPIVFKQRRSRTTPTCQAWWLTALGTLNGRHSTPTATHSRCTRNLIYLQTHSASFCSGVNFGTDVVPAHYMIWKDQQLLHGKQTKRSLSDGICSKTNSDSVLTKSFVTSNFFITRRWLLLHLSNACCLFCTPWNALLSLFNRRQVRSLKLVSC